MKKTAIVCIAALLLQACTTMKPIPEGQSIVDVVKPGDKIELIDKTGHISSFTVGKVMDDTIVGTSETSGMNYSVAIKEIEQMKVETIDGGKTALAVTGGIIAVPFILAGGFVFLLAACEYSC